MIRLHSEASGVKHRQVRDDLLLNPLPCLYLGRSREPREVRSRVADRNDPHASVETAPLAVLSAVMTLTGNLE